MKKRITAACACLAIAFAVGAASTALGADSPEITDPKPGSTLQGDSQLFSWTNNGAAVEEWQLTIGTSLGAHDIRDTGPLSAVSQGCYVSGLPTDGRTLYVRLFYRIGMFWLSRDYSYTSSDTPKITSPAPGSTLSRDLQTFTWTDNGNDVSNYQLSAGTYPGGKDIFDIPVGTSNSVTVNGLPADGGTVYVTLGYMIGGVRGETQSAYIAQGNPGFISDFNNNQDGWYNPGAGHWDYGYGVFCIRIYSGTVYTPTFVSACYRCVSNDDVDYEDFEYEADIFTAGADRDYTGIIFRGNPWPMLSDSYNAWNSGYAFVIGKDGFYQILKIRDCSLYTLKDWTKSDAINQGEYTSNVLKVSAYGTTMDFFINGFYVATIVDQEYTKGNVGVIGLYYSSTYFVISLDYAELTPY